MAAKKMLWIILTLLLNISTWGQSGKQIPLILQPDTRVWLEGTSTMHDYRANASRILGTVIADSAIFGEWKRNSSRLLHKVEMIIPVKSLLSGDEKLDENMYDALKADDHENITYRMSNASVAFAGGDTATLRTVGTLSVGGKEKESEMSVTLLRHEDGILRIKGNTDLLMTDFDIDPPTFMFVLTTDNKVKISFDLLLQPQTHVHK